MHYSIAIGRMEKIKPTNGNPLNLTMMNWVNLVDKKKNVCCYNKWLHPEKNVLKFTRIVKVKKQKPKNTQVISSYLRRKEVVEYENKHMLDFQDINAHTLSQNVETDIICSNLTCSLSHDMPVYEAHYFRKFNGYIDLPCTLLAVSKLFGDIFLYKNETYITNLFKAFADDMEVETYHVRMILSLLIRHYYYCSLLYCACFRIQ